VSVKAYMVVGFSLAVSGLALAQSSSSWRVYRAVDGLAESACLSVTFSRPGRVLARHYYISSVDELDGYSVTNFPAPETANGRFYGSPGGQVWTVVPEGLQEWRDNRWVLHPVPEIASEFYQGASRVIDPIPLVPVRHGYVLFLTRNGLMAFNADSGGASSNQVICSSAEAGLGRFSGLTVARDGGLWISAERGLVRTHVPLRDLRPGSPWRQFGIPEDFSGRKLQQPLEDVEGGVTAVAEDANGKLRVVARLDGSGEWSARTLSTERLRYAWRGPDQTSWAVTINSLLTWKGADAEPQENDDISPRQFFDVALEPGGAFWLATSEGLYRWAPPVWQAPQVAPVLPGPVHALAADAQGAMWILDGEMLSSVRGGVSQRFPLPQAWRRSLGNAHSLYGLRNGSMLIDSGGRLFEHQTASGSSRTFGDPENDRLRALGTVHDGSLWVQRSRPDAPAVLERFDGERFEPILDVPGPDFSTNYYCVIGALGGDIWLGADEGLAWYHQGSWKLFRARDDLAPEAPQRLLEVSGGRIWAANNDQLWEFDCRDWRLLRHAIDRITALLETRDGSIWVGSQHGVLRWLEGSWLENGVEDGLLAGGVHSLQEDDRGNLWAGNENGLRRYTPANDADPPRTIIQPPASQYNSLPEGALVNLSFDAQDRWKFTFRTRHLFSYRLDDRDWTVFAEQDSLSLPDLAPGKHYFQVRAMDRNGNIEFTPAQLEFAIVLPWYRESRSVWIASLGFAGALFFAGLAVNRHRRLVRSYAEVEQKVTDRTRELEIANLELVQTHKMKALGTLAAGIAHDFNNILSIVKGSAQIIEENLDDPEKIRTRVDRIKTVVEQGAGIVKAMLGFSRDSEQQATACDLNRVVEETVTLLGDRFLREIQVRVQPTANLPGIMIRKGFVQQAVLNFIFNAAEAMTDRREVIIRTHRLAQLPPGMVLAPQVAASHLAVTVQDFGSGIAPEIMPRIFEPFFTTKAMSVRRGTGLGLSMVYELAKRMGAGIAVESVVNEGSSFTLVLPLTSPPATGGDDAAATPPTVQTTHS